MTRLPVLLLVLAACGVDPAATLPDAGTGDAGEDLVCTPRVKLPADCKDKGCPGGYACQVGSPGEPWECRPRCETTWTSECTIPRIVYGAPDSVDGHRKVWLCEEHPGSGTLMDPPRLVTESCPGGVCVHLPDAPEGDDWRPWHSRESPCSVWNWGLEHWPYRFN